MKHMDTPARFTEQSQTKLPAKKGSATRVEFDTTNMRDFIDNRGIKVLWERSWYCTCRNTNTLAPDPNCHICLGRGIAYEVAKTTEIMIQSQDKGVSSTDLGLIDTGTAIGTTYLDEPVSFRDRLTVPDVSLFQSFIFDVTQKRVDNGMYLMYDVQTISMIKGVINKEQGVDLAEGEDYTVDLSKNILYPKPHLIGTNISLVIETTLRYIVTDILKESRYQYTKKYNEDSPLFENLPRKLLLKREDIYINPEPFSLDTQIDHQEKDKLIESKRQTTSYSGGFFGGKM